MSAVAYPHIEVSPEGVPVLSGTRTKVIEVALDHLAHHWDAMEIQRQHPHLGLAQIHAALTYYYDHESELDSQIAEQIREVRQIRAAQGPSPVVAKLRAMGKLP